jgi:nicotinamidase-related amidase
MLHPKILDKAQTVLVIVDVQEAFRTAIADFTKIAERITKIVQGFQILELPIVVTEQYPKGLGRTAEEVLSVLPQDVEVIEKSTFSSCGASVFLERLQSVGAKQILLCGLETHICVNQTVHDLLNQGFEVHLLTDAVASRFENDKQTGLQKMFANGATPATVEMSLFELLKDSKHEQFKAIQGLVK